MAGGRARTSAPVWALAVSSPPLILRSLGEGGSRAAASASPQAFLFSRVPYFSPPEIKTSTMVTSTAPQLLFHRSDCAPWGREVIPVNRISAVCVPS